MMTGVSGGTGQAGRGFWTWLAAGAFAGWLVVTAASQHPHQLFDRLRRYDLTGQVIPNWRFFAPEPARHDFHILHRVLTADGEQTAWRESNEAAPRRWRQAIWFPERRRDKAVFDHCSEIQLAMTSYRRDLTQLPAYQMLCEFVALAVRREFAGQPPPQGFQFVIARHTGHEQQADPEYLLASPFIPLETYPVPPRGGSSGEEVGQR